MLPPVSMLGLASALPSHKLGQAEIVHVAREIFAPVLQRYPQLIDVFVNSGIEQRYSVVPMTWFHREQGWQERTQAYLDGAGALFVKAAERALAKAGIAA